MSRSTSIRSNLILLGASSLITLLVADVTLSVITQNPVEPTRVWNAGGNAKYEKIDDFMVPYRLNPGIRWSGNVLDDDDRIITFTINQHGMRGPATTLVKPDSVRRVLFIGDSVTEGSDVSDDDIFPRLAEHMLNQPGSETRVEVLNGGVGGYNTYSEKWYLYKYGLQFDPDIVVVGFCFNDIRDIYRALSDRDLLILDWDLPREAFPADSDFTAMNERLALLRANWEQIMSPASAKVEVDGRLNFLPILVRSFLQDHSGLYGLISHTTYFGRRPRFIWEHKDPHTPQGIVLCNRNSPQLEWLGDLFTSIVDTCGARNIPVITIIMPHKEQLGYVGHDCAQANLAEVLEAAGSQVVDVLPAIREQWASGHPQFLPYDALHLNEAGHRVVAEQIVPKVRAMLVGITEREQTTGAP